MITPGELTILQNLYALADEWVEKVMGTEYLDEHGKGAGLAWSVAAEQLRARLDRIVIKDMSARLCELEREALRRCGVSI